MTTGSDRRIYEEEKNVLIQGIHHVCIKCKSDELEKVRDFYSGILGLPEVRSTVAGSFSGKSSLCDRPGGRRNRVFL